MASVSLVNVTKKYGNLVAVDRLNLEIGATEFFVILGPAGAGKTSTLKMIAGIEAASEGEILIGGTRVNARDSDEIDVAMIFETYALYPHRTVFDNMAFPLKSKYRKKNEIEIKNRVEEVSRLLEMESLLQRYPGELSGGQKQRVSLGRALVRKPRVFLMDEPLSHLDAQLRHQMRRELKKLKDQLETSVIFVTHNYLEALSLADRIAVLNKGKICQVGTPEEVYSSPEDIFVASLLGHPGISLIKGKVISQNDLFLFSSKDGAIVFPFPSSLKNSLGRQRTDEIIAGIRPSAIDIDREKSPGAIGVWSALSEHAGNKHLLQMQIGETSITGIMRSVNIMERPERLFMVVQPEKVLYIVFLGPSGCGKTTIMRMIAGLETVTSGRIFIGSKIVNDLPPGERNVALAFENYALYPPLTARENIIFPLKAKKLGRNEIESRLEEVAFWLELEEALDRKPSQLSGGQQQMVSLARCIIRDADVTLMDEPLSHLDSGQRFKVRLRLKALHEKKQKTIIYVTHDQLEALALADKIVIMNNGRVQQVDTPQNIYSQPKNTFVAGFVGEPPINFVRGRLFREGQCFRFRSEDQTLSLLIQHEIFSDPQKVNDGLPALLSIRPEDVSLESNSSKNSIGVRVEVYESLGEEGILELRCGQNVLVSICRPGLSFRRGQDLNVSFNVDKIILFDPNTEARL